MEPSLNSAPVRRPVDGTLTLPDVGKRQVRHLVIDYLARCRESHLFEVTIVNGAKRETRQRTTHKAFKEMPEVAHFRSNRANGEMGGSTTAV